jgi:hypothetical protein
MSGGEKKKGFDVQKPAVKTEKPPIEKTPIKPMTSAMQIAGQNDGRRFRDFLKP